MSAQKMKIKKGDQVIVITGKDKGKTGEVLSINIDDQRVIVQGVNVVKKHIKPTQFNPGGLENVERSIHASNVAHIDPESGKATRIKYETGKDGVKTRIASKSGKAIGSATPKATSAKTAPAKKAAAPKKKDK